LIFWNSFLFSLIISSSTFSQSSFRMSHSFILFFEKISGKLIAFTVMLFEPLTLYSLSRLLQAGFSSQMNNSAFALVFFPTTAALIGVILFCRPFVLMFFDRSSKFFGVGSMQKIFADGNVRA